LPYLGDYLGHLLSELSAARLQADLESVRVAELYASHPLLRHLPVPHFRLPTVTFDVPVVIKAMEQTAGEGKPKARGEPQPEGVALSSLRQRFDAVVRAHLKRAGIDLVERGKTALRRALDDATARLVLPSDVPMSMTHVADELVLATALVLRNSDCSADSVEPEIIERLVEQLRAATRVEFLNLQRPAPRLVVLVTTAELRKAGPQELLGRVHLSIVEEAFEWTLIESQGTSFQKLVPE
jgi:hypothetical protein